MKNLISISKKAIIAMIAMMLTFTSCRDEGVDETPVRANEINEYLNTLSYAPDELLNV